MERCLETVSSTLSPWLPLVPPGLSKAVGKEEYFPQEVPPLPGSQKRGIDAETPAKQLIAKRTQFSGLMYLPSQGHFTDMYGMSSDLAKFIDYRSNPSMDINCGKMSMAVLGFCLRRKDIPALASHLKELVLKTE